MNTLLFVFAASVPVPVDQIISLTLEEGDVSFFEFQLPVEGMTVSLLRQEGSASLFASDKVRIPNSAFYDYRIDGDGEVFVDLEELLGGDGGAGQRRKRSEDIEIVFSNTTLFVSVEGTGEINMFQIRTSVGNTGMLL